ncbi:ATP-binding cassette, subfamily B [Fontibacillus panacisegetis]|uniref:ATP-binding cassette, subfamily B n=1 Tax=Fontibacillus panacisegetis TaxID=670482 RepID=A0A1G7RK30_9BACL|nr:ABC transporter ATP-binding protein [Fontibacillus panacisegetis]SDG11121.1 ATP-binding cassette, subfamily B [Fontibacillus panacisegetis]
MNSNSEVVGLFRIVSTKKGLLIVASVFSTLSSLLQIVPFFAVFKIIEELLMHAQNAAGINKELIIHWGMWAFLALVGALIALYIGGMCSHIAAFNILYELRVRLSEHVAKVPMGYHNKTASGELKKIIEVSVEKIEKFIAHQLPDLVSAVIVPLSLLIYLFWLDWRMALVLLLPIGIGFWLQARVFGSEEGQKAYRDFQYAVEEMNATGIEYVRGMPAVKVFGITAESFLTFKQAVTRYRDISLNITNMCKTSYSLFFIIISSLFVFAVPIGILLSSGQAYNQSFAVTFILILIITPSLSAPLLKLLYLGSGLREIVEGNKRIAAVFAEEVVSEPTVPRVSSSYDVSFDQVSFAYESKDSMDFKHVLSNISFVARAGEMTALVGPSGGGKSTIANLLLRFWDVKEGQITIGDVPIREMGTERLMDTVSFVFQDVHLFYDTIEENIRMGNTAASKEEVMKAARTACCHEFIEKLEYGYDTKIDEGGTYLSGGEAQRIAIARALLKNAPVLVLDEATAYADAENERKIQQGLAELVKDKTVLIIAHRLSTIRGAEQIIVVNQGEIAERGTHEELRERNGLYEQMWRAHISAARWKLGLDDQLSRQPVAAAVVKEDMSDE